LDSKAVAFIGGQFQSYRVVEGTTDCVGKVKFYIDPKCRYGTVSRIAAGSTDPAESWPNTELMVYPMDADNGGECNTNIAALLDGTGTSQFLVDPYSCTDTGTFSGNVSSGETFTGLVTECNRGIIIEIPSCTRQEMHGHSQAVMWVILSISVILFFLSMGLRASHAHKYNARMHAAGSKRS
jgi:hypothetical protein